MEWKSEIRDGFAIVGSSGPVDHRNVDHFEAKLNSAVAEAVSAGNQIIIDFRKVDYMSSVGLRVLARADKTAKEGTVSLAVANLSQTMQEIFQISRFDKIIRVYDSIEKALESGGSR